MTKSTRITFLATPEQHASLKAAAEREGRSLSNYILTAALGRTTRRPLSDLQKVAIQLYEDDVEPA